MKNRLIILLLTLLLLVGTICGNVSAEQAGYTISADSAVIGQEYVLIIVGGERNTLQLVDNDSSILYIQQKSAVSSTISFLNVDPMDFETATAFVISEEGLLIKCEVLENTDVDVLILPAAIKEIEEEAFYGIHAKSVKLPDGLTAIRKRAFAGSSTLKDVYIPTSVILFEEEIFKDSPNVIIHGYSDSKAEEYARNNGIAFVAVD